MMEVLSYQVFGNVLFLLFVILPKNTGIFNFQDAQKDNIANKVEIKIGARQEANIEVLSGLNIGDIIVAEGLKKVYPRSKIKPIEKGSKNSGSEWKKKAEKNNN